MVSKTLTKEEGGTVESFRFEPSRKQVARSVTIDVIVENKVDGEVVTRRHYSLDGASALQTRLQSVGFKA